MAQKPRVLVVESQRAVANVVRRWAEQAGFEVDHALTLGEAVAQAAAMPPDVILLGAPADATGVCAELKKAAAGASLVLLYPPEEEDPSDKVRAAKADAFLVGPIKRGNLRGCLDGVMRTRQLARRVAQLEEEHRRNGPRAPGKEAFEYELFKRMLVFEIQRSRRYRYPLAVALAAVDGFRGLRAEMDPRAQAQWMGKLLASACKTVREVDFCVSHTEGRFLILMPHTGLGGARVAASRLRTHLAETEIGGRRITVSIGLAAYEGTSKVSFGGLLRAATAALKQAQAEGGDHVATAEPEAARASEVRP